MICELKILRSSKCFYFTIFCPFENIKSKNLCDFCGFIILNFRINYPKYGYL